MAPLSESPLYEAAYNDHVDLVTMLLDLEAEVDVGHNQGVSPLHIASYEEHERTVSVLLERGSKVNLN